MEITQEQKDYIKSIRLWIQSQVSNREEVENEINYTEKRIELDKKQLDIFKERVKNNINFTKSGTDCFLLWCKENGIDPEIQL